MTEYLSLPCLTREAARLLSDRYKLPKPLTGFYTTEQFFVDYNFGKPEKDESHSVPMKLSLNELSTEYLTPMIKALASRLAGLRISHYWSVQTLEGKFSLETYGGVTIRGTREIFDPEFKLNSHRSGCEILRFDVKALKSTP